MKVLVLAVVALLQVLDCHSFIIPDELPSILSVIYSNIPTIKKGTDSRIGWGFRLGDRADFQVLVELGPQTNTQPLANQGDGNRKRNTLDSLANELYAQRQEDKRIKDEESQKHQQEEKQTTHDEGEESPPAKTEGEQWLKTWSKSMNKKQNTGLPLRPKPGLGVGEIDAKSVIPDDSALLAKEAKKKKLEKLKIATSTEGPASTTANAEDMVDLR